MDNHAIAYYSETNGREAAWHAKMMKQAAATRGSELRRAGTASTAPVRGCGAHGLPVSASSRYVAELAGIINIPVAPNDTPQVVPEWRHRARRSKPAGELDADAVWADRKLRVQQHDAARSRSPHVALRSTSQTRFLEGERACRDVVECVRGIPPAKLALDRATRAEREGLPTTSTLSISPSSSQKWSCSLSPQLTSLARTVSRTPSTASSEQARSGLCPESMRRSLGNSSLVEEAGRSRFESQDLLYFGVSRDDCGRSAYLRHRRHKSPRAKASRAQTSTERQTWLAGEEDGDKLRGLYAKREVFRHEQFRVTGVSVE